MLLISASVVEMDDSRLQRCAQWVTATWAVASPDLGPGWGRLAGGPVPGASQPEGVGKGSPKAFEGMQQSHCYQMTEIPGLAGPSSSTGAAALGRMAL